VIPGKSPLSANSRKQIRQIPKSRIKPWFRPQRQQRLTLREENFGVLIAFAINAFLAIYFYLFNSASYEIEFLNNLNIF
jgi:hypothetical protein